MTEGKTLEVCYFEPYEREHLYHLNKFKYQRSWSKTPIIYDHLWFLTFLWALTLSRAASAIPMRPQEQLREEIHNLGQ